MLMDRACWQLSWSPVEMMLATSQWLFLSDQRKSVSRVRVWRTGGKTGVSSRPCASFCCAAAEPRLTYSELALGRLAACHGASLRNAPADQKKKPNTPELIIGQAGKEGKECCLGDGRFAVGLQNNLFLRGPSQPSCACTVRSSNVCAAWMYQSDRWTKVLLCEEVGCLCSWWRCEPYVTS